MKKYFIIAGEPSGDLHGSKLIRAIKNLHPNSSFMGHGGNKMKNEGMRIIEHRGEGLGNQFLGQIRQTSAILHVVRCFDDKNITHMLTYINH